VAAVRRLNTLNSELRAMMAQYSDSVAEAENEETDTDTETDTDADEDNADAALLQIADVEGEEEEDEDEDADADSEAEGEADQLEVEGESDETTGESMENNDEYDVFVSLGEALAVARNRTRNVDPVAINTRHTGVTMGQTDPARLGIAPGQRISILKETPVYDSMGEIELAIADPQKIGGEYDSGINAGMLATINGEECVMGIRLRSDQGRVSGWVPVTAFSHAPEIVAFSKTVERALSRTRPNDNRRKTRMFHVHQKSALGAYKHLFVFPHQTGRDNSVKAYFTNRRTGTVPLLLNVPTEGGSTKWGEIADVLPLDAEFYKVRTVPSISIPLFARGANEPVADVTLKFVYGYTLNKAQEKRWGWINHAVLGQ